MPELALLKFGHYMSLPQFRNAENFSALELTVLLIDRVRSERRKLNLSQAKFAKKCGIPLRTYKRFELGQSNSLESFMRIVIVFERVVALDLLFPPAPVTVKIRTPVAALERAQMQFQKKQEK